MVVVVMMMMMMMMMILHREKSTIIVGFSKRVQSSVVAVKTTPFSSDQKWQRFIHLLLEAPD